MAQIFAQHLKEFTGAGLEDFSHHALGNQARRSISDRGDFHLVPLRNQGHYGVAEGLFDFLRLDNWGS